MVLVSLPAPLLGPANEVLGSFLELGDDSVDDGRDGIMIELQCGLPAWVLLFSSHDAKLPALSLTLAWCERHERCLLMRMHW